jgi:DNA-binding response OmpR family regulator
MTKVLVVEDDKAILRGLSDSLKHEGYEVVTALDGEAGYLSQRAHKPDLIVLDLMLPKLSGMDLCRKLRAEGLQTPILMLTARSQESDRVAGLDIGADDYVTKPFSVRELMARIRAVLRRTQYRPDAPARLTCGDLDVDFDRFEAHRQGKRVEMTRKEFAILKFLAEREGQVVSREELLDEVWGLGFYPESRTVDYHMAGLRAKLEANPAHPLHLRTVHGVGYKFVREAKS